MALKQKTNDCKKQNCYTDSAYFISIFPTINGILFLVLFTVIKISEIEMFLIGLSLLLRAPEFLGFFIKKRVHVLIILLNGAIDKLQCF